MEEETTQQECSEELPRESGIATVINEKSDEIVDILIGQRLKHVRMILNRVEVKVADLFLVN